MNEEAAAAAAATPTTFAPRFCRIVATAAGAAYALDCTAGLQVAAGTSRGPAQAASSEAASSSSSPCSEAGTAAAAVTAGTPIAAQHHSVQRERSAVQEDSAPKARGAATSACAAGGRTPIAALRPSVGERHSADPHRPIGYEEDSRGIAAVNGQQIRSGALDREIPLHPDVIAWRTPVQFDNSSIQSGVEGDDCSISRAAYGITQHPGHRSRCIVVGAVHAQRLNTRRGRRLRVCPANANADRGKDGSANP
jgi:hypothetical protein